MKVKRYFGTNLQEAIQRARLDLGENILLVDSNSIPLRKQGDLLETLTQITVALPDGEAPNPRPNNSHPQVAIPHPFRDYLQKEEAARSWKADIPVTGKIAADPVAFPKTKPATQKGYTLPSELITIFDRLVRVGITPSDADYLIKQVYIKTRGAGIRAMDDYIAAVRAEVIACLDNYKQNAPTRNSQDRVIALVGATGAGKTSVLMKMATHPRIFKNRKVAIVTTDNYRMGAKATLQAFSTLVNIPLFEAYDVKSLQHIIGGLLKEGMTVLIDTAGRSPYFPNFFHELQALLKDNLIRAHIELVVSAAFDLEDLILNMSLWSLLEPAGLIVTKLDETARPGKVLSLVRAFELPVHFICSGQNIPQDITPGKGAFIWEKIEQSW